MDAHSFSPQFEVLSVTDSGRVVAGRSADTPHYQVRVAAAGADLPSRFADRRAQAVTVAAIDRLVHHATILEMNVDSYRRRSAAGRSAGKADGSTTTTGDNLADNIREDLTA